MKLDKSYKNIGVQRLLFNGVKVSASGSQSLRLGETIGVLITGGINIILIPTGASLQYSLAQT